MRTLTLQLYHAKAETQGNLNSHDNPHKLQLYHAKAETWETQKASAKMWKLQLYHAKAETQFPPYHRRQRGTGCNFTMSQQLY